MEEVIRLCITSVCDMSDDDVQLLSNTIALRLSDHIKPRPSLKLLEIANIYAEIKQCGIIIETVTHDNGAILHFATYDKEALMALDGKSFGLQSCYPMYIRIQLIDKHLVYLSLAHEHELFGQMKSVS